MNDRCVSLLEQYDMKVLRTWKGRNAILCETEDGIRILREYNGPKEKLSVLEAMMNHLYEAGILAERILRSAQGSLIIYDRDKSAYILKEYHEGRESQVASPEDNELALKALATIHRYLKVPLPQELKPIEPKPESEETTENSREDFFCAPELPDRDYFFVRINVIGEYERYNRELRRIRKQLRSKTHRTDFEIFLLGKYDFFLEQAEEAVQRMKEAERVFATKKEPGQEIYLCHGDFQYHNVLITKEGPFVMNYEKCLWDDQLRDFLLFFRKVMEKEDWNIKSAEKLILSYDSLKPFDEDECLQMKLRLSYPEKFRKIVSHYYNSGKYWIPGKSEEKLLRLISLEPVRQECIGKLF